MFATKDSVNWRKVWREKTTYCEKMVYDWATGKQEAEDCFPTFEKVLFLKCRDIKSDLWEAIDDQLWRGRQREILQLHQPAGSSPTFFVLDGSGMRFPLVNCQCSKKLFRLENFQRSCSRYRTAQGWNEDTNTLWHPTANWRIDRRRCKRVYLQVLSKHKEFGRKVRVHVGKWWKPERCGGKSSHTVLINFINSIINKRNSF